MADRRGSAAVLAVATALVPAAWMVFAAWSSLWGVALGILILDVGMQGALVANQHTIFGLEPEARSRLNTILMTSMFFGGALGSAGAGLACGAAGWEAACAFGMALGLGGMLAQRLAWIRPAAEAGTR